MTGSERPSPEPLLKKEASPAVLGGREFWKCSGALKCLKLQGLGHPSRTLEGNSRKRSESVSGVFPEFFRNFLRKVPAVLGVGPNNVRRGCPSPEGFSKNLVQKDIALIFWCPTVSAPLLRLRTQAETTFSWGAANGGLRDGG